MYDKKTSAIIRLANSQFQTQSRMGGSNAENRPVTFFTGWVWSLATFTALNLFCLFQHKYTCTITMTTS